jgi:hypothetical protein
MPPLTVTGCCGEVSRSFREGVRAEIIDGTRQDDPGTGDAGGSDRIIQHRQHQLTPIAITGRIDRVDNDGGAFGGRGHIGRGHCVALHPEEARCLVSGGKPVRVAIECANRPASGGEAASHFAANTAAGAENESRLMGSHVCLRCLV